MSVTVLNTDAGLSGKTLVNAEDAQNVTGLKSFNRSPNAPFAVQAASAVVTNLNADQVDGKEATALVLVDGTQAMTGTLDLGTIGKIQFPAAQSSSAGVNVLDDYEEGTWSPTITGTSGSGITYASQVGHYVKVGKLVTAWFNILLSGLGTASGAVSVASLPFTAEAVASFAPIGPIYFGSMNTAYISMVSIVQQNTTTASIVGTAAATATLAAVTVANLGASTNLAGTLVYRASA